MRAPRYSLFTAPAASPKAVKGEALGVSTIVLHLAPSTLGGRGNVCRWASPACIAACLNTAGRGGINAGTLDDITARRTNTIQLARIRRTEMFFDIGAAGFVGLLADDIRRHVAYCTATGQAPAVRLNGTSDLPWERIAPELFAMFPSVTFYDYTKAPVTARGTLPANYSLTMSFSGLNWDACADALAIGRNVAVVFAVKKGQPLPASYMGFPVIDGDVSDVRFRDPVGCIVGLRAKGRAATSPSPFVVRPD